MLGIEKKLAIGNHLLYRMNGKDVDDGKYKIVLDNKLFSVTTEGGKVVEFE